jgi:hypothetical protein
VKMFKILCMLSLVGTVCYSDGFFLDANISASDEASLPRYVRKLILERRQLLEGFLAKSKNKKSGEIERRAVEPTTEPPLERESRSGAPEAATSEPDYESSVTEDTVFPFLALDYTYSPNRVVPTTEDFSETPTLMGELEMANVSRDGETTFYIDSGTNESSPETTTLRLTVSSPVLNPQPKAYPHSVVFSGLSLALAAIMDSPSGLALLMISLTGNL